MVKDTVLLTYSLFKNRFKHDQGFFSKEATIFFVQICYDKKCLITE